MYKTKNQLNMKRLKRIISILLLSIILGGCFNQHDVKQNSTLTVITGKVRNMEVYPNTKEFTVNIIDFRGKKTTYRDSIKGDGAFKIEVDLYKTQDINVYPLVGKIIANPGDSIHLAIDFRDIGNIQFFGDNQKTNTDLNKYLNSNYCVFEFSNRETVKMEFGAYTSFCDSVKLVADKKQSEFVKEFNPTPEVISWTKDYINIKYQQSLLDFPFRFAHFRKIKSYLDLDVPDDYYGFLENVENEFSDSVINTNIYEFLNLYIGNFSQRTIRDTTLTIDEFFSILMNELLENHKESYFKQLLIGDVFYQKLNQNDLDFFTNNQTLLEKNVDELSVKIPLTNYYRELQKQMNNPEINSNAILTKLNGTAGKSLIDSIWLQNKGKVIYIDFWATWCGPCKTEMPNSKKLSQKLAGENIEFVYLCINSNEEQWKLALSQMQLDGTHYLCDKEQSKNIRSGFKIDGIPFYMLVSKHGHIVESGSYLRPSYPATIDKIEKLLHEN
jgi:thiol-disulfide isomerase/thioredoxin